ncbi:hypothetical protein [Aeoliella sp.]|uniref:hypothetical protein n=1 Tax=Aeoliella sp. TaxID=2795800 RepID=UPI003CCB78F0
MFRFRLRTFLIAITVFCLLLGWRVAAVESVERPVRELERLGWQVSYDDVDLFPELPVPMYPDRRRSYWQKMLMGHQEYDFPDSAWIGKRPGNGTNDEVGQFLQQSCIWFNRLPTITVVDFSDTQLTKKSIEPLADCEHLRHLLLSRTNLDDSAIDGLAQLTQLDTLILWETNLTAEGAAELERRLPNCEIDHDFNDD